MFDDGGVRVGQGTQTENVAAVGLHGTEMGNEHHKYRMRSRHRAVVVLTGDQIKLGARTMARFWGDILLCSWCRLSSWKNLIK